MKLVTRVNYLLLLNGCRLLGMLPTWFLYHVLLDVIYFFVYKVAKYRVRVVRTNLRNSFPDLPKIELRRIEKRFYYHLAEIFVDTIDITSISREELDRRIKFLNIADVEREMAGRDWIAALAHYGSWEYFCDYQMHTESQIVGIYRPLHNEAFEQFYRVTRSRFGMVPVSMNVMLRYYLKNRGKGKNIILGLIADQTPAWFEIDHWYEFLNQPTPFFMGMATLAQRFKLPIYFLHIKKVARARYECWHEQIYDGVEAVDPHEIIERYAVRLEQMIKDDPAIWMWSHKRWKHKPKPGMEFNVKL